MTWMMLIAAIVARKKDLGISDGQLAEQVGVDRKTINRWLNRHSAMPMDYAISVMRQLGMSLQVVICDE